jgi:hypothetical protein
VLVDDVDPGSVSGSGDTHGDGVRRFRLGNGRLDERRELPPEHHRIGEYAQASHLDIDDATDKDRLDRVERRSKLVKEINRR